MSKTVTKTCPICNTEYKVPYYRRDSYYTCGKDYCKEVRAQMRVSQSGRYVYIQCDMCNKAIFRRTTKIKKTLNFCSKNCLNTYHRYIGTHKPKEVTYKVKYYGDNWFKIARTIRKRDNFTCSDCGITQEEYGKELSVHHIKPFVFFDSPEEANKLDNLITICEPCHRKRHSGANHPSKYDLDSLGLNADSSLRSKVRARDKEKAKKVVNLIKNTQLTLADISREVNVSYTTVQRIYNGSRWVDLTGGSLIMKYPRAKAKIV
uniref:HNH endonuclease n=1 Tax=Enterococcus phage Sw5 TaxID=2950724 RepID=A0A9E7MH10_9CAUD|nr:HNH endonuclease [Enterococcus phage Sw5]